MTAIKTKKNVSVLWDRNNRKTVCCYGDKDPFNKAIWYDVDGNAYELIYARRGGEFSLNPRADYDRKEC